MESQYNQAYSTGLLGTASKDPPHSPHHTWNTVPIILSVDTYGLGENDRSKYTVNIDPIRDVVSIELIQASIPVNGQDLYVILNINGYSRVKSNNNNAKDSFCIIPCQNPGIDVFHNMRRTGSLPDDNYIYYFPEPSRINKLQIELISPTGNPIIYNDNHALTFEIKTLNRAPKTEARFQASSGVRGPW
jgi:hypothetical protein